MPVNCPVYPSPRLDCSNCRYLSDNKCWWFSPALELSEILTVQERLKRLEAEIKRCQYKK
jgi:hypothetical protein